MGGRYKDEAKLALRKREYTQRYPLRRQLSNKLAWIKRQYGESAKQYFIDHPVCENCTEDRLACLAIHHVDGKTVEKFKTLCNNCHAVEHHGSATYKLAALV